MWLWMMAAAFGSEVYINDVLVDPASIADTTLEPVSVRFDPDGTVRITAPGYQVEVVGRSPPVVSPASNPVAPSATSEVPASTYWLVTEDHGTTGHSVECWINGQRAAALASGGAQRIIDVGPWLRPGDNRIEFRATSRGPSGGNFYVYVGAGRADDTGTVLMDDPAVQFGLDSSRVGGTQRAYSLVVN